jgi:hypothetical protein
MDIVQRHPELLRLLPALGEEARRLLARRLCARLVRQLEGQATDEFLELLLEGLSLAFHLWGDFKENLRDFRGAYLFRTADGAVAVSATFADMKLTVHEGPVAAWDVAVTFASPRALWKFLLSRDQDILDSLLRDEVTVEGNINYVYKLGFMARELTRKLGIGA